MSSPRRFSSLCRFRRERSHAGEVIGGLSQQEQLLDPLATAIHGLPYPADCLAPAKDLLDTFALALTDRVAGPACRAAIDRRTTCASRVLRHMRRHAVGTTVRHEARRVVVLVRPNGNGHAGKPRCIGHHVSRRVALGFAAGLSYLGIHYQPMPVIAQDMADIAEQRARAATLAEQLRLIVRTRFMCLVAAFLAVPV